MQLGFVGLGKMGGNMVHRIQRDSDHEVVAFDFNADAVETAEGYGANGAASLEDLVAKLEAPRMVWMMVPSGETTEQTVVKLGELLDAGDTIIDGGNSNWHDDVRRAAELDAQGIHYIDVGTSGGVWGLEVGYCMMVGGHDESVARLAPILDVLAPAGRLAPLRRLRRRALREDGPQRRRVRDDAGLRRGLRAACTSRSSRSSSSEVAQPVEPRLGRPLLAVRARRARLRARRATTSRASRATSTTPARAAGRSSDGIDHDVPTPVIAASLYARFYSRGEGDYTASRARRAAQPVRRPRRRAAAGGGLMAAPSRNAGAGAQQPADRGAGAPAGPRHDAGDLRRDRRPRPPQAAAGALQPRPRGRAARALQPRRRLAPRPVRRRLPRLRARGDQGVLAPRDRRRRCSTACSSGCATSASRSTTHDGLRASWARRIERARRGGGRHRSTARTTSRPRRSSSR